MNSDEFTAIHKLFIILMFIVFLFQFLIVSFPFGLEL